MSWSFYYYYYYYYYYYCVVLLSCNFNLICNNYAVSIMISWLHFLKNFCTSWRRFSPSVTDIHARMSCLCLRCSSLHYVGANVPDYEAFCSKWRYFHTMSNQISRLTISYFLLTWCKAINLITCHLDYDNKATYTTVLKNMKYTLDC